MLRDATYAAKHAFGVRSLEFAMSAGTTVSLTCGMVCCRKPESIEARHFGDKSQ